MKTFATPPFLLQPLLSKPLLAMLVSMGGMLGAVDIAEEHNRKVYQAQAKKIATRDAVARVEVLQVIALASSRAEVCLPLCNRPPAQEDAQQTRILQKPVAKKVSPAAKTVRLAELSPEERRKNPNAIRISLADAPTIASKVKMVNGKGVCPKKSDRGHRSNQNKKGHVDRQCCLDPDEIPNPRCAY